MIYLLEDDDSIRELVIYTLNSQGMEARGFARPSAFWTVGAATGRRAPPSSPPSATTTRAPDSR